MNCPCRYCDRRTPYCHAYCPHYVVYKAERERIAEMREIEKMAEPMPKRKARR